MQGDGNYITYALEGALAHRDRLGNGSVLRPGEFQRMTVGTGIRHSEFNPSETEPAATRPEARLNPRQRLSGTLSPCHF